MGAGTGSATKLVLCSAGTGRACGENGSPLFTNMVTTQTPPGEPKAGLAQDRPALPTVYHFLTLKLYDHPY